MFCCKKGTKTGEQHDHNMNQLPHVHTDTDKQKRMMKLLLTEHISITNRYSNILEQCFPKPFC